MADPFVIVRVRELPAEPTPNTMYIIRPSDGEFVSVVFTGFDPSDPARLMTVDDVSSVVESAIEQAATESAEVFFVDNITAMWALAPMGNAIAYVADTSGDPTAVNAKGAYIYHREAGLWVAMPSGADEIKWTDIVGRPNSTAAQIDAAVQASHTHSNKSVLDRISDVDGTLKYRGVAVGDVAVSTTW